MTARTILAWATTVVTLLAQPAVAFMYEDDPDFFGTPAADLPEEHDELLHCAEQGVSECQVILGEVWEGSTFMEPHVYNLGEAEKWYRAAARQGHRRGIDRYASLLCFLNTVEPRNVRQRAIDSLAWRGLIGGLDIRGYFASSRVELCDSVNALRQQPDYPPARVIDLVRARAMEIRGDLTAPLHGWNSAAHMDNPLGGWTTIPLDGKTVRIRILREPPGWEIVGD